MGFREDHEMLEQRVAQAESEALSAHAWFRFLKAHREVVPCEANLQIVKSYFAGEPFTVEALEEAIQNPSLRKQMVFQTSAEDRQKSLETIERITGSIPVTAQYSSDAELASKAEELTRRRELNKLSPTALKKIIEDGRPQVEAYEIPADMTREKILALSAPDLRRLLDRAGSKAVTERLNSHLSNRR